MFRAPLRVLVAALAMGAGGWALARAIRIILASVSAPSFQRALRPARFDYSLPADWNDSAVVAWLVGIACVLVLPILFNHTWASRRLFSVVGIVKLGAAVLLLALMAATALVGSELFVSQPWGGGGNYSVLTHLTLILFAAICGAILFGVLGDGMIGGAVDRWIQPDVSRSEVTRAVANGVIVASVMSLLAFVAANGFTLLFQSLFGFLSESAEVSPLGWQRLSLGFSLGLGLLLASYGGLVVALSPGRMGRSQRTVSLALAGVPVIALAGLTVWFRGYCRTQGEMGTTFAEAARLEAPPQARLMILPGPRPRAYAYPMEIRVPGFRAETVGATQRNIELAAEYLGRHQGRWTVHTLAAWHVAPYVHERLLEPEAALRARAEAAEATGSLLTTGAMLATMRGMPKSDAVLDVSARVSDPAHFAGGEADIRLQGGVLVPHDRSVTGVIELQGGRPEEARIALYRQGSATAPAAVPSGLFLVAAVSPDARGRFTFDGLPPAFYSVGVLLPQSFGSNPERLSVQGDLHVVDLSKDRHRDSAGTVKVQVR